MSAAPKFTPGPWKVIPSIHGPQYACVQYGASEDYTSLEMKPADAALTAAAPELYEALRGFVDAAERGATNFFDMRGSCLRAARAALAKVDA